MDEYLHLYDAIRMKGWGRYFERMVRWPANDGTTTNPLHDLVNRMSKEVKSKQTFRDVFEMTLFDPARDAKKNRNRQCLSFLSFKPHQERGLMLTAIYRNQHYIARALGNFIGLGNLMEYIAEQVGISVGPLTCVATHAKIDTASAQPEREDCGGPCHGWTITEARTLVDTSAKLLSATLPPIRRGILGEN
jgi:thymidylate synthase